MWCQVKKWVVLKKQNEMKSKAKSDDREYWWRDMYGEHVYYIREEEKFWIVFRPNENLCLLAAGNIMIIKWVAMILWALLLKMLLKMCNGNDEW